MFRAIFIIYVLPALVVLFVGLAWFVFKRSDFIGRGKGAVVSVLAGMASSNLAIYLIVEYGCAHIRGCGYRLPTIILVGIMVGILVLAIVRGYLYPKDKAGMKENIAR